MARVTDVPLEWVRDRDLDIVYYGEEMNAPCCKVRMIMHMYGFRYTSVDGPKKHKSGNWSYVPVVDIEGIQFNESFHISQVFHKIATGKYPTERELRIEMELTYELTEALREALAATPAEIRKLAGYLRGARWCLFTCFACIGKRTAYTVRRDHPNLLSLEEYHDSFVFHLGENEFFNGSKPGFLDAGLFGVLTSYRGVSEGVRRFLGEKGSPLQHWHERMVALEIPSIFE